MNFKCQRCGKPSITVRPAKWCGRSCKELAYQARHPARTKVRQATYKKFPLQKVNRNLAVIEAAMMLVGTQGESDAKSQSYESC